MKATLAILAHESAQPTIDDFLPQWKKLDCNLVVFLPKGHKVEGFRQQFYQGENAYSGRKVFERFLQCCETLNLMRSELYIIAEYDTVNLSNDLPQHQSGYITSNFILADGIKTSTGTQLCALSPWVMDYMMLKRFIEAGRKYIEGDGDAPHMGGLLDRWIGSVIQRAELPHVTPFNMIGYPWHPGIEDRIKNVGATWVHGFKLRKEFGTAWTG